ncbi:MAG: glycoside hydrolase domain-containing protein [Ferruginibacter sp.]
MKFSVNVAAGKVQALWCGIDVPKKYSAWQFTKEKQP